MASLPYLKSLKRLYFLAAKNFRRSATVMTLAVSILVLQAAQGNAVRGDLLSQFHALLPIHVLSIAVFFSAMSTVYLMIRPRTVYLVDYTCFQASSNYRRPMATFLEHERLSPFLTDSSVDFIERVLEHSGMGEETWLPQVYQYTEPYCCLDEARTEAELVIFSVIDALLAKTCISIDAINVLITNCSLFCPMPSLADTIVYRYKLRGDLRIINLSGMGCSAGVIAVGLARSILKIIALGSHALVVSTETLGPNYYAGNNRSMQLGNLLFRMGGTAKLLSTSRSKARFRLAHVVRTITAANDSAYRCVYQEEDGKGNKGINLSKNLLAVAKDAIKAHITSIGPLVLPASELLKFFLFSMARKVLPWNSIRFYIPDFRLAFEHFCIHVGGPAVISSVQHGLNLSDEHVEPSRMTLHRFGNQSSTSVWYQLAYIEAKGRMCTGDRVWMIGLGAGYKCNTAVWVCIQPSHVTDGPWASCIHRYPMN